VTAHQHDPVIVKAHAPAGNVILCAIVDRHAALARQFLQVLVVLDVGIPFIQPVVIMIAAAVTAC
jgi:hypothetical protein